MGHPIHPMLVPFPIAFFVGAFVCDVIYAMKPGPFWPVMSLVLIGFGIIGALLAAIFGLVDYFTAPLSPAARKTAVTHMVLNIVTIVVFAAAFIVRNNDVTSALGFGLTIFGVLVLGVSSALGGHLAYHHRIGVEEKADERSARRSVSGTPSAWSSGSR
jgi:uncharacterized membrane protein